MKRVVYITNARIPTEKAHGYQIAKMCEALAFQGLNVTLFYPNRRQPAVLVNKDPFSYYAVFPNFTLNTLQSFNLPECLPSFRFTLQAVSNAVVALLYTACYWQDPGVIFYTRDRFIITFLLFLRSLVRARLVYEVHTFPKASRVCFLRLLRRLDHLVVITRQLKRLFVQAGIPDDKITVAPDAVDLAQFQISDSREACRRRLGLPLNRSIIGYIGRFHTMGMEKGIPELVQAMKHLTRKMLPSLPLLLCVGGPMERVPTYQAIAREHDVPLEMLRFVDRVPNHQVPYWMRACDVCTIPWPWNDFSAYYTSPMKLFEYMAVGTPIVASDLPSLREILRHGENAWLVKPGDVQDLAAGLWHLLQDQNLAQRLSDQAKFDVRAHTWEGRAEHIMAALDLRT